MAPHQAEAVWDALSTAGPFGIRPVGYKAVESLRLEKGYRYWSSDITPDENPLEAGLGFCVRLSKGDFIGRDAIVQAQDQGLSRRLGTVTVTPSSDDIVLYGGEAVSVGDRIIGRLRSAGYGYTVGCHIGLVYLPLELLVCPYHQWSYGRDGELLACGGMDGDDDLDVHQPNASRARLGDGVHGRPAGSAPHGALYDTGRGYPAHAYGAELLVPRER
jgi:hypothetical protein